ncbi:nitrilase-related carbon-nitrogen hydrolase [Paenibacillus aquistagni]|uniref:Apolipoprotein N-acyltransferase n=1 Tax=Paenibacillus aquistagni TaxID=1852522 RepID=A0A1X7J5S1_9BACL|nr:nitrilase-related carbon-nitrogen hydrolase [Paenibacillus aquistagni]SMG22842.1 apolipoprotein N-acyltransferase [Paenibacillus aquistagni]
MKKYSHILLLVLGGLFMMLSNGKFLMAPAAWIFPILFLYAIEKMSLKKAMLTLTLVTAVSNQLSFHNMLPSLDIPMFSYIPAMAGALYAFPFILQQLSFRKTNSFVATLILPCTYALLDFSNLYFNPFGTFGILGYSQHGFLPIVQVASVVGVTGITFLIMWTASIIYWLRLDVTNKKKQHVALLTAAVLICIVTLGGWRVVTNVNTETVTVSGIHTLDRTDSEVLEIFNLHEKENRDFLKKTEENLNQLIEMTITEAKAGAKIIHHSEGVAMLDETQKSLYLDSLRDVAKQWGVYIVTVPYVFTAEGSPNENVLYMIDPSGEVAFEHFKYGGNLIERTVEGDKQIKYADTAYGRLSGIICWDKDFPAIVNQAGEKNVDILFIPSADWKEISPYHTIVGNFRGVENGANIVTQTVNGMSMISDYKGQTLAQMDHFTSDQWVMRGQVPTKGMETMYSKWGKYFVWYIIITLLISVGYIHFDRRKKFES